jgi:hypothetical protein
LKFDHIQLLITLTGDYIKRLLLHLRLGEDDVFDAVGVHAGDVVMVKGQSNVTTTSLTHYIVDVTERSVKYHQRTNF